MLLTQREVCGTEACAQASLLAGPQRTQTRNCMPLGRSGCTPLQMESRVNPVSSKAVPCEANEEIMLMNQFPNQKRAHL